MYADHQEWAKGKPQYFDQKNHNQAMLPTAESCARKFLAIKVVREIFKGMLCPCELQLRRV